MSRVDVHEEVPGQTADAALYNTTLDSWVAATDIDTINQDNVRDEGLTRRSFADNTVDSTRVGTNWLVEEAAGTPGGPYGAGVNVVTVNGNTIGIGPFSPNASDIVKVYCSAFITSASPDSQTLVMLQRKVGGGGWANLTKTRRPLSNASASGCAMRRTYTVTHRASGDTGPLEYRLIIEDSPGADVYVQNAVLFATVEGR